jgi:hypothetical protein
LVRGPHPVSPQCSSCNPFYVECITWTKESMLLIRGCSGPPSSHSWPWDVGRNPLDYPLPTYTYTYPLSQVLRGSGMWKELFRLPPYRPIHTPTYCHNYIFLCLTKPGLIGLHLCIGTVLSSYLMDRGCFLAWVSRGRACKLGCERNEHPSIGCRGDLANMGGIVARKSE